MKIKTNILILVLLTLRTNLETTLQTLNNKILNLKLQKKSKKLKTIFHLIKMTHLLLRFLLVALREKDQNQEHFKE
jgi:hypothetical protein